MGMAPEPINSPATTTDANANPHAPPPPDDFDLSLLFVLDSLNIHRLMITGIVCASKFFSDLFYTNKRYAKVGGLSLPELNDLERQFLTLAGFKLAVTQEEFEQYATKLVEYYLREVIAVEVGGVEMRGSGSGR